MTVHQPDAVYTGAAEFAYGGLIASLIDCHSAGAAAIFWMQAQRPGHRSRPDTTLRDCPAGGRLRRSDSAIDDAVLGTADEIGDRKVIVISELSVEGTVTARGRAVMVRISPDT